MKEHALFLEADFTKANSYLTKQDDNYKNEFEKLLSYTVDLNQGIIRSNVPNSGEIVTEFTLNAEKQLLLM